MNGHDRSSSRGPVRSARPAGRLLAAGTAAALIAFLMLAGRPPVYQLSREGRPVAAGAHLAALQEALQRQLEADGLGLVTLVAQERSWEFRLADLGLTWEGEEARAAVAAARAALPWYARLPWSRPVLQVAPRPVWDQAALAAALQPLREELQRPAVPARLEIRQGIPLIHAEESGVELDLEGVLPVLQRDFMTGLVRLPLLKVEPDVTAAQLQQLGIRRLIAEWSTYYDPHIPRAENVQRAARALNGRLLRPGEILSYNAAMGPITTETGWREAAVIVGGELVPGVGGGVCQVATTFYGAALRANLEILERHPHQLAVPYIAPSQDAAIAQGWEDLKIRNTTGAHLYIEAQTEGGRVTFRLYGQMPEELEVRLESQVIGPRPFAVRQVVDPSLAPGQTRVQRYGSEGLISEAYRLVYRDGKLISRERLSRDYYLPTSQILLVGPGAPPPQSSEPAASDPAQAAEPGEAPAADTEPGEEESGQSGP